MRVPHAARTLHQQLQGRYKKPTMTAVGEPDGFGVKRSVEFDKTSSGFLAKIIEHLDDPRIADHKVSKSGILTVTFSGTTASDRRDEFPLDAAETVAAAATSDGDSGDGADA